MNSTYCFEEITETNQEVAFTIYQVNRAYFALTGEVPTQESVAQDRTSRPPQLSPEQKHFLLVRFAGQAVAVVDLLTGYPEATSGYLGLLLVGEQRQGHGRRIVSLIEEWLRSQGYTRLELGVLEQNTQGLAFWTSQGFVSFGIGSASINDQPHSVIKFEKGFV